jgi:dipeptidyl aminopeptidase/acylaminoacyl peptidase
LDLRIRSRVRGTEGAHESLSTTGWLPHCLLILYVLQTVYLDSALALDRRPRDATERSSRPVTVEDAIQMTKVGDLDSFWGSPLPDQLGHFSPDGKKFVVVTRKGNIASNTRTYSLLLWNTGEVEQSPPPQIVLTMSSSSNRQAIEDVTWLADSERIAFLGEHPGELHQVYTYNIRTQVLHKITRHQTNVVSYSMTPQGKELAFVADEPAGSIWDDTSRRQGFPISTESLSRLIEGKKGGDSDELFFQLPHRASRRISLTGKVSPPWRQSVAISPDGTHITVSTLVMEVPAEWKEYSGPEMRQLTSQGMPPGQYSELNQYELVDTRTGKSRILLDSPVSPTSLSRVAWSPDSHSVVITNTYLPLEDVDAAQRETRRVSPFTVEVSVQNSKVTRITAEDSLVLLRWDARTSLLCFQDWKLSRDDRSQGNVFFRKNGDDWQKLTESLTSEVHPRIVVEENMNTPPRMFVVDANTRKRVMLFDPNPQFKELRFANVEEVQWQGSDGRASVGGLYYPFNYSPGHKYPLVIQTHGWVPGAFWIDGPFTTAFAAQPLAAKDIMVLQADEGYASQGTPEEVTREVSRLEGAIDYLDRRGLIDTDRLGIIGFSRTCLFVKYALTHSKRHFAAASVTDGVDAGYFQYLTILNVDSVLARDYEGVNGGLPFGEGLRSWMDRSPSFNIESVQTPLRIVAENPDVTLFEWEWFAALTRLGKPVEMVALQDGEHVLQKPWERLVSQQGNVDWFAFWLKGEEDLDPGKERQYRRWRRLRDGISDGR